MPDHPELEPVKVAEGMLELTVKAEQDDSTGAWYGEVVATAFAGEWANSRPSALAAAVAAREALLTALEVSGE